MTRYEYQDKNCGRSEACDAFVMGNLVGAFKSAGLSPLPEASGVATSIDMFLATLHNLPLMSFCPQHSYLSCGVKKQRENKLNKLERMLDGLWLKLY
jgi:hypothetical protein